MNRRNFVVGLGTVATVSGVASVTAASFADSVTSGADFRVVVSEDLTFRRGDGFENADEFDTELEGASQDSDFEDAVDADDPVAVHVDDGTNEDLDSVLALLNDPDNEAIEDLNDIYEIENSGAAQQDINIIFEFGDDVGEGNGREVDEQTVLDLFSFEVNDGDQISPDTYDDGQEQPPETLTIDSGDTVEIDLIIDLDSTATDLANAAEADPFEGTEETLDLVESIEVGTDLDLNGEE